MTAERNQDWYVPLLVFCLMSVGLLGAITRSAGSLITLAGLTAVLAGAMAVVAGELPFPRRETGTPRVAVVAADLGAAALVAGTFCLLFF